MPAARDLLRRFGLTPKKRLGQNFLVDAGAAAQIAQLATAQCNRVVEIGPGTGTLTRALLQCRAQVSAIEVDPDMIAILRSQSDLAEARIIEADALTFDYGTLGGAQPWCVTGNLPYHIATPLILRLIEMRNGPASLTIMMQKDVVDRLRAHPGTRAYGSLSIAVQYAMRVEQAFGLAPDAFYPSPKVDSAIVQLTRLEHPAVEVRDDGRFWQVVRAAFAYRRKTLANSLSLALGVERAAVTAALRQLGYDTEIRGEQLAIADFARLSDHLSAE